MIIHQDSLLALVYDPKTDILVVKWPNLIDVPATIIGHSFTKLVDSINHYHITKLLIDSKGTSTYVTEENYKPLAMKLTKDLASTRLKKIARVVSDDALRETRSRNYNQEIRTQMTFNFTTKEFDDKESALAWLASNHD